MLFGMKNFTFSVVSCRHDIFSFLNFFYFWQCSGSRGSVSYFREDVNADGNDVFRAYSSLQLFTSKAGQIWHTFHYYNAWWWNEQQRLSPHTTVFYYNQIICIETPSLVVSSSLFLWNGHDSVLIWKLVFLNLWPFLICNASNSRTGLMSPLCWQISLCTSWEKTDSFFA